MNFDSGPHSPPPPLPAEPGTELDDLIRIISSTDPAGPSVEDRETYLEQLRTAIERARELEGELAVNPGSNAPAPSRSSQRPNNQPIAQIARMLILHIDDDPATRELVAHLLFDAGYTV